MTNLRLLLALSAVWALAPGATLPAHAQVQVPGPIDGVPVVPPGLAVPAPGLPALNGGFPDDPTTEPLGANAAVRIVTVTAENLPGLPAQLARTYGISLRATQADLENNPAARNALMNWVLAGGVVFLHTDAAQLFGYETVPAREGDKQVAGQLLGRARVTLPFASHPMLVNARAGRTSDPARLPGISVVFYSMQPGDHLVVSHPSGTPLLAVTDLASNDPRPLYAAAIAPFGRGWAVVTPDSIDQRRADGAAFARNLLSLVPGPAKGERVPAWISVAQSAVEDPAALARELDAGLANLGAAAALPQFGAGAPNNGMPGAPPVQALPPGMQQPGMQQQAAMQVLPPVVDPAAEVPDQPAPEGAELPLPPAVAARGPVFMLSRGEALAIRAALGGQNAPAVLDLLQARIAVAQGDLDEATKDLAGVPEAAAESQFLLGQIAATRVDDVTLSSAERAAAAGAAAQAFVNAAWAQPLFPVAGVAVGEANAAPMLFGATQNQLQGWATEFKRMAAMFALEPPLTQTVGNGAASITVRFFAGDPAATTVVPAAKALASANGFGWRGDREEIVLFPTAEAYLNYRAAAGLNAQNVPLPAAGGGDVIGQRIIMVSAPFNNGVILPPGQGNFGVAVADNTTLSLLARLHTYALLGAWFDGNGRIPAWFALGLENGADVVISGNNNVAQYAQVLQTVAQANRLLTPAQFEGMRVTPTDVAAAEAASIVNYFYQSAGSGAVTEWVQRVAMGEESNSALVAAAGGDEESLFTEWGKEQFGNLGAVNGAPTFGPGIVPQGGIAPGGIVNGPGVVFPGGFPNGGVVPGGPPGVFVP